MKWARVYMTHSCPHCTSMRTQTLDGLGDVGWLVMRTYLDTLPRDSASGEFVDPLARAVTTVPATYIHDSATPLAKPTLREGVLTIEELTAALGVPTHAVTDRIVSGVPNNRTHDDKAAAPSSPAVRADLFRV